MPLFVEYPGIFLVTVFEWDKGKQQRFISGVTLTTEIKLVLSRDRCVYQVTQKKGLLFDQA